MNNPKDNRILSALPKTEYQRLVNLLEPVELFLNEILLKARQKCEYLYFPTQGIVSLLSVMDDNSTTEIGLIGKEGMVGTLQFIGDGISNSQSVVQVKGTAMRIEASVLRVEFKRSEILQKLLLGYVTEVASKFQKEGMIQYKRGLIRIVSAQKLEAATCECYQLIYQEFSRLLKY